MICLHDFTEASSSWTLAEDESISNVFVSIKGKYTTYSVRSIFVVCSHKLHLYSYFLDHTMPPVKEDSVSFSETVYGVYVVKRSIVLVLLQNRLEVLEMTVALGRTRLTRRKQCLYFGQKKEKLEIVSIPEDQGSALQIFFKDTGPTIFTIYSLKVECLSEEQVSIGELHKFC